MCPFTGPADPAKQNWLSCLEQVVRNYRMCERLKLLNEAREAHALRELNWQIDEDGYWVLKGRFTPEQGAVIRQALEKAMDALFDERVDEHPDVSADMFIRLPSVTTTSCVSAAPLMSAHARRLDRARIAG
jgi:hypothetical protein